MRSPTNPSQVMFGVPSAGCNLGWYSSWPGWGRGGGGYQNASGVVDILCRASPNTPKRLACATRPRARVHAGTRCEGSQYGMRTGDLSIHACRRSKAGHRRPPTCGMARTLIGGWECVHASCSHAKLRALSARSRAYAGSVYCCSGPILLPWEYHDASPGGCAGLIHCFRYRGPFGAPVCPGNGSAGGHRWCPGFPPGGVHVCFMHVKGNTQLASLGFAFCSVPPSRRDETDIAIPCFPGIHIAKDGYCLWGEREFSPTSNLRKPREMWHIRTPQPHGPLPPQTS